MRIPTFYLNFLFWFCSHFKLNIFQTNFIFTWLWLLCISSHGCFPVKLNYFIAEAPSNPLLNLPFKWSPFEKECEIIVKCYWCAHIMKYLPLNFLYMHWEWLKMMYLKINVKWLFILDQIALFNFPFVTVNSKECSILDLFGLKSWLICCWFEKYAVTGLYMSWLRPMGAPPDNFSPVYELLSQPDSEYLALRCVTLGVFILSSLA